VVALSPDPAVCQGLAFSYGVHPVAWQDTAENWRDFAGRWLREHELPGQVALLVAGPSGRDAESNHRIEFLRVGTPGHRP
jgi:pyruvate kinase